jgi:cardiolipin synthase
VRLLLDGFGAKEIEPDLLDAMDGAGVQVAWFRRPTRLSPMRQNHRCHRKVLVTDEHTAFTGGVGIAQEWCGAARNPDEWRDTHVQVRGPAVDGIAAAFAQNWAECHDDLYDDHDRFTPQEQPGRATVQVVRGSAAFGWQDMQTVLRVLITSAQESLRLATAYFAPDTYFIGLLAAAARRGVTVEILLPGPHTDQRACLLAGRQHYQTLVDAGVDVREYQPTMLHTKIITVDGVCSLIGSTNFNRRSMEHDEEVVLAVLDEDFTAELDADFDADRERSEPVDPSRWKRRPLPLRLAETAVTPIRRFL